MLKIWNADRKVPTFDLYKNWNITLSVQIRCVNKNLQLNQNQIDELKNFNKFLYIDILLYNEFSFETCTGGGLFALIKSWILIFFSTFFGTHLFKFLFFEKFEHYQDDNLDWDRIKSPDRTVYDEIKSSNRKSGNLIGAIVRLDYPNLDERSLLFKNRCGLLQISQVCNNLSPASSFPKDSYESYQDYFEKRYKWSIKQPDQPLIETTHLSSPKFNYLTPSQMAELSKKERKSSSQNHYISEHLLLIPFNKNEISILSTIPSIFHRMNTILKVLEFKNSIEEFAVKELNKPLEVWIVFIDLKTKFWKEKHFFFITE